MIVLSVVISFHVHTSGSTKFSCSCGWLFCIWSTFIVGFSCTAWTKIRSFAYNLSETGPSQSDLVLLNLVLLSSVPGLSGSGTSTPGPSAPGPSSPHSSTPGSSEYVPFSSDPSKFGYSIL